MKFLSLWQPWASLIALGEKRFETRSWPTKYKGPLAIHASQTLDSCWATEPFKSLLAKHGIDGRFPCGAIVAVCSLAFCHRAELIVDQLSQQECSMGDYRVGRFAFELTDVVRLESIPMRGMQGLKNVPAEIERQIREQLERDA